MAVDNPLLTRHARPFLQDEHYFLALDLRSEAAFNTGHVLSAHHYGWTMSSTTDTANFPNIQPYTYMVLYDDNGGPSGSVD